jgi:carboxyl-terminal processing protease
MPLRGGGCALVFEFSQWAMPVYGRLVEALREHDECRAVVLDLRGNSGGLVVTMPAVGGLFLDQPAAIGTMITGGGELKLTALPREVDDAGRDVRRHRGPLAILTDRGSVSCSDMFAGGMQALGRARIFGDTSAGMALPSASVPLPSGDRLLYPTAEYIDPKGRRIEGVGVVPDTPAPPTLDALRKGRDPALDAALAWAAQQP